MIIRGGENIPVAYVENVLYEHPDLADVALVGVPDPRLQERACAVVTLKADVDGFDLARMREFLGAKGVAKQYWPERLEVFDALPRTASGKIRKFELRDQLAGS
jgi:cyclohexanecarboxylate-CoA ligase